MARFAQERNPLDVNGSKGDARRSFIALRPEPARAASRGPREEPRESDLVATVRGAEREEAGGLRRPSSGGEKQEAVDERENALAELKRSYFSNQSLLAETAAKIAAYDAAKSDKTKRTIAREAIFKADSSDYAVCVAVKALGTYEERLGQRDSQIAQLTMTVDAYKERNGELEPELVERSRNSSRALVAASSAQKRKNIWDTLIEADKILQSELKQQGK